MSMRRLVCAISPRLINISRPAAIFPIPKIPIKCNISSRYQKKRFFSSQNPLSDQRNLANYLIEEGSKLLEMGSTEMAMDAYTKSLESYPTSTAYYNIGNIYFQMGQIQDARDSWLKSLDMEPTLTDAIVNLGNLEMMFGRNVEKAIGYYRHALELQPSDGEIRFNLGIALDQLKRFDEAVLEYQCALEYLSGLGSEGGGGCGGYDYEKRVEELKRLLKNAQTNAFIHKNQLRESQEVK